MMLPLDWRTVCVAAILLGSIFLYQKWTLHRHRILLTRRHGCQDPPKYPHTDRIQGSDLHKLRSKSRKDGSGRKFENDMFARFGKTWEENFFGTRAINTMDSANIKQVNAVQFDDYERSTFRRAASMPLFGPSILTTEGPEWKHHRDLVKPIFNREVISDLSSLARLVDQFFTLVPADGKSFDIQPMLDSLFLDAATEFIFGEPMGSLQQQPPAQCEAFLSSWTRALRWIAWRRDAGWRMLFTNWSRDYIGAYSGVHSFVDRLVKEALERTKYAPCVASSPFRPSSTNNGGSKRCFLDELAAEIKDPVALRYQAMAVFTPAQGAAGVAVGNVLWALARHPQCWRQLRQVALQQGDRPLTFELLKSLSEFRYVVQEVMRLYGPGGRQLRNAVRDTVLPKGGGPDGGAPVFVEKGTTVIMHIRSLHYDKDLYGADADQFRPERWIGRKLSWDFLPFSGGGHICPAQQQVLTQIVYVLVRFAQRFASLENRDPALDYDDDWTSMIIRNRTGVQIAVKRA